MATGNLQVKQKENKKMAKFEVPVKLTVETVIVVDADDKSEAFVSVFEMKTEKLLKKIKADDVEIDIDKKKIKLLDEDEDEEIEGGELDEDEEDLSFLSGDEEEEDDD